MKYEMIRGPKPESRCKNIGAYGSRLYCNCGCQRPQPDDPKINLTDVIATGRSSEGYANYILSRDGIECGSLNTQYSALFIDDHEFLGCDREGLQPLLHQIFDGDTSRFPHNRERSAGDTIAETACTVGLTEKIEIAEQDNGHANHTGYCTRCHSYCYGDCIS
ncbi:MAG: hypothetical protein GY865_14075 [candidate division Zixibacteria bacterium]|nr:hypothetical protein [candidate division Zixibacteria bacterium]